MSEKETEEAQVTDEAAVEAEAAADSGAGAATVEAGADSGAGGEMAEKLAAAEAKAQENWDQLLRTKAEMDNLRRRNEQDLEKAHKFALDKFAQELLPVRDSLEMGLKAAEEAGQESLIEGTQLTLKMLETAMEKFGIKAVHPVDEPFNPELHQAMSMLEAPDKAPNTVIDVMQKGYTLNDRLIRPAMVVVSKAASSTTES